MWSFRVHNAQLGETHDINIRQEDFSFPSFKNILADETNGSGIPAVDQILLIGPTPFKRLDTNFSPDMQRNGEQIFLYDRRSLQMASSSQKDVVLLPIEPYSFDILETTDPELNRLILLLNDSAVTPLLRALPDYDKHFLVRLREGEAWRLTCVDALANCKNSTSRQNIQLSGLAAAVTNLQEHYAGMRNSFETAKEKLMVQHLRHKELLTTFDSDFSRLGDIAIDPALVQLFESSGTGSGGGGGVGSSIAMHQSGDNVSASASMGRTTNPLGGVLSPEPARKSIQGPDPSPYSTPISANAMYSTPISANAMYSTPISANAMFPSPSPPNNTNNVTVSPFTTQGQGSPAESPDICAPGTLIDCIPLAKEKVWYAQCVEVHSKVTHNLQELQALFDTVSVGVTNLATQAGVNVIANDTSAPSASVSIGSVSGSAASELTAAGGSGSRGRGDSTDSGGDGSGNRSRGNSADSLMNQSTPFAPALADEANLATIVAIEQGVSSMTEHVQQLRSTYRTIHSLIIACMRHQLHVNSSESSAAATTSTAVSTAASVDAAVVNRASPTVDEPAFVDLTSPAAGMNTSFSQHSNSVISDPSSLASSSINEHNLASDLPALVTYLDSVYKSQGMGINANLKQYCSTILQYKDRIAASQTKLLRLQTSHLRRVAELQTEMHSRLKKGIDLVKKWAKGHNQYFEHLDQLSKLPKVYSCMVGEIARRRAYHSSFLAACTDAVLELGRRHDAELQARETFMQEAGKFLPPAFHQIVPSLRAVPDNFLYKLPEFPELPEVTPASQSANQSFDSSNVRSAIASTVSVSVSPVVPSAAEYAELLQKLAAMTAEKDKLQAQLEVLKDSDYPGDGGCSSRSHSEDHTCTTHATLIDTPISSTNNSGNSDSSALAIRRDHAADGTEFSNLDGCSTSSTELVLGDVLTKLEHVVHSRTASFGGGADAGELVEYTGRVHAVLDTLMQATGGAQSSGSEVKISFTSFKVNDYALFLPLNPKNPHVFTAFQQNCPNRFLSLETVKAFRGTSTKPVPYILGKIIEINSFEVTPKENPFNLPLGTIYYAIHVEVNQFMSGNTSTCSSAVTSRANKANGRVGLEAPAEFGSSNKGDEQQSKSSKS